MPTSSPLASSSMKAGEEVCDPRPSPLLKNLNGRANDRPTPKAGLIPRNVRAGAWATMRRGGQTNLLANLPALAAPVTSGDGGSPATGTTPSRVSSHLTSNTAEPSNVQNTSSPMLPGARAMLGGVVSPIAAPSPTGTIESPSRVTGNDETLPDFNTSCSADSSLQHSGRSKISLCSPLHSSLREDFSVMLKDESGFLEIESLDALLKGMGMTDEANRRNLATQFMREHEGGEEARIPKSVFVEVVERGEFDRWLTAARVDISIEVGDSESVTSRRSSIASVRSPTVSIRSPSNGATFITARNGGLEVKPAGSQSPSDMNKNESAEVIQIREYYTEIINGLESANSEERARNAELTQILEAREARWRELEAATLSEVQTDIECAETSLLDTTAALKREKRKSSFKAIEAERLQQENEMLAADVLALRESEARHSLAAAHVAAERETNIRERSALLSEIDQLQEQLHKLNTENKELRVLADDITARKDLLELEQPELMVANQTLGGLVNQLRDEHSMLQRSHAGAINDLHDENDMLNKTVDNLREQLEKSHVARPLQDSLNSVMDSPTKSTQHPDALSSQLAACETALQQAQQQASEAAAKADITAKRNMSLMSELDNFKSCHDESLAKIAQLTAEAESAKIALGQTKQIQGRVKELEALLMATRDSEKILKARLTQAGRMLSQTSTALYTALEEQDGTCPELTTPKNRQSNGNAHDAESEKMAKRYNELRLKNADLQDSVQWLLHQLRISRHHQSALPEVVVKLNLSSKARVTLTR